MSYLWRLMTTALAPVLWGTTYIVTTEWLPPGRPFLAATLRTLPAGILLLLWVRQRPQSGQMARLLLLSLLNIAAFQTLLFIAAYRLPGGIAAVISSMQPLILMCLIWLVNHKSPSWVSVLAVLASMLGMYWLLVTPEASWDVIGLVAAFGAAVVMASGLFLMQRWSIDMPLIAFTAWQLTLGGLMLLPLTLIAESLPTTITLPNILGYAWLALFGSVLAYSLYFRGAALLPGVALSVLGVLSPVTATIIGWWWLDEHLNAQQLCGLLLVLAAVLVVQWQNWEKS